MHVRAARSSDIGHAWSDCAVMLAMINKQKAFTLRPNDAAWRVVGTRHRCRDSSVRGHAVAATLRTKI